MGPCARHWDLPSSAREELSLTGNTCLSCMESPHSHPFLLLLGVPAQDSVSVLFGGCGCSGGAGLHSTGRAISTEVL